MMHINFMHTGRPANSPPAKFGARLRELREEANLSQREVAVVLGISQPSYAKWERREVAVTASQLMLLAETFGCEPGDFFVDDEPSRKPGPLGRSQKIFEQVSQLPRYRQRDILDMVERLVVIHQREQAEKENSKATKD